LKNAKKENDAHEALKEVKKDGDNHNKTKEKKFQLSFIHS